MESIVHYLPSLNALLNSTSAVILIYARWLIKQGRPLDHKRWMLIALGVSALFLTSYLIYHYFAGSVRYPLQDWTRALYLAILLPHTLLASLMVPFVIAAVIAGLKHNYRLHTRITKILWPVWIFVSVSGVVVYLMLYHYAGAKASL